MLSAHSVLATAKPSVCVRHTPLQCVDRTKYIHCHCLKTVRAPWLTFDNNFTSAPSFHVFASRLKTHLLLRFLSRTVLNVQCLWVNSSLLDTLIDHLTYLLWQMWTDFQNSFTSLFVRKLSMYRSQRFYLICNVLLHYLVKVGNSKMLRFWQHPQQTVDMFWRTLWGLDLTLHYIYMFSARPTTDRTGPAIQVSAIMLKTKTVNVKSW